MTTFDLASSVSSHPLVHPADFWPSLLFCLSKGQVPVARTSTIDLDEQHGCSPGSSTGATSSWTITWAEAAVTGCRSDCFASADSVASNHHDRRITEDAAVGTALCALASLCPGNQVSRVAKIGTRADYYLNGSSHEMIEIGGSNDPTSTISVMRSAKVRQLAQCAATHTWLCVVNFSLRKVLLEMIR